MKVKTMLSETLPVFILIVAVQQAENAIAHRPPRSSKDHAVSCDPHQYFDEEEGRCLSVTGGGNVMYVNYTESCGTDVLKPHCTNLKYYYICKENRTILTQCTGDQRFENRLQKCVDSNDTTPRPIRWNEILDGIETPACQTPGNFPVPGHCDLFYKCEMNEYQMCQSVFQCPEDMEYELETESCTVSLTCGEAKSNATAKDCLTRDEGMGSEDKLEDNLGSVYLETSSLATFTLDAYSDVSDVSEFEQNKEYDTTTSYYVEVSGTTTNSYEISTTEVPYTNWITRGTTEFTDNSYSTVSTYSSTSNPISTPPYSSITDEYTTPSEELDSYTDNGTTELQFSTTYEPILSATEKSGYYETTEQTQNETNDYPISYTTPSSSETISTPSTDSIPSTSTEDVSYFTTTEPIVTTAEELGYYETTTEQTQTNTMDYTVPYVTSTSVTNELPASTTQHFTKWMSSTEPLLPTYSEAPYVDFTSENNDALEAYSVSTTPHYVEEEITNSTPSTVTTTESNERTEYPVYSTEVTSSINAEAPEPYIDENAAKGSELASTTELIERELRSIGSVMPEKSEDIVTPNPYTNSGKTEESILQKPANHPIPYFGSNKRKALLPTRGHVSDSRAYVTTTNLASSDSQPSSPVADKYAVLNHMSRAWKRPAQTKSAAEKVSPSTQKPIHPSKTPFAYLLHSILDQLIPNPGTSMKKQSPLWTYIKNVRESTSKSDQNSHTE